MAMKPNSMAELIVGKAIGAIRGFAESFNWMAQWCFYFAAQGGIKLDVTTPDRPKISLEGFDDATDGQILSKDGDSVKWKDESGGTDEIDVITGISFSISNGTITATITKKPVKLKSNGDSENSSVNVAALTRQEVVVDSEYNQDGEHRFVNKVKDVFVLNPDSDSHDVEIFQTQEHVC